MGQRTMKMLSDSERSVLLDIQDKLLAVPHQKAEVLYRKLRLFTEKRNLNGDNELLFGVLFRMGEYSGRNGNIAESKRVFEKILKLATAKNDCPRQVRAQANLAILNAQQGYIHKAIDIWEDLLTREMPLKQKLTLINNISVGYGTTGQYNKAIEYAYKALEMADEVGDEQEKISPYINLGSAYNAESEYERALEMWIKAEHLSARFKNIRRQGECQNNISIAYNAIGKTAKALEYSFKAMEIRREYATENDMATSYVNIGFIQETAGEMVAALKYYEMALEIYQRGADLRAWINCLNNIAHIHIGNQNFDTALPYLDKAYELCFPLNLPDLIRRTYTLYSELFSHQGNYHKAWEYQSLISHSLSDSLDYQIKNTITKTEADYYRRKIELQANLYQSQNTELKKRNREIKQKTTELAKTNSALSDTVAMLNWVITVITHDVRFPLANMAQVITMINENAFDESEAKELMVEIQNSSNEVYKLITEMLDGIRLQRKRLDSETTIERFDLIPVLNSIYSIYQPIARHKRISLEYEMEEHEMKALFDQDLLKIVLRNLLNNSLKFTPEKGKIQLKALYEDKWICILIQDDGIGMSKRELNALLKGSAIIKNSMSNERGTGLGFSLCQDSIKKMNGKLAVTSETGIGTQIKIYIPLANNH